MTRSSAAALLAIYAMAVLATSSVFAEPAKDKLAATLESPITMKFEKVHLQEVFQFINQIYDINIVVDNRAVAPAEKNTEASTKYATDGIIQYVDVKAVPLKDALHALLNPLGLDYSVQQNYIWISTPESIKHEGFADLETRIFNLPGSSVPDINADVVDHNPGEVDLVALISRVVPMVLEPTTKRPLSFARYNLVTKQLVVHNTPANLDKVQRLLDLVVNKPQTHQQ